jgi:hypothetical protein
MYGPFGLAGVVLWCAVHMLDLVCAGKVWNESWQLACMW